MTIKTIPFLDLKRQYGEIKKEIDSAVKRVLNSQYFILGEETRLFESEFAAYLGCKYVLGVGSGTEGLILALRALGIKKGDEVITPVNSFIATTLAITEVGATPIFTDCDPNTYEIPVAEVKSKITKKTKAILPVHLYGAPAQIDELRDLARKKHLYLVEDACQAAGSKLNGKQLGTFGDVGVFSFYPGKNLGAYGDGGAICTNNESLFLKLQKLRNYGQSKKYYHDEIGINSRLDEIQSAILRVKLKYLDKWNRIRNSVARRYNSLIDLKTQKIINGGFSNYHIFSIECRGRDKMIEVLKENGVQTLIHYPVPIHLQKCYSYLGYKMGDFPVAESIASRTLSLPMYPELKLSEVKRIIALVNRLLSS